MKKSRLFFLISLLLIAIIFVSCEDKNLMITSDGLIFGTDKNMIYSLRIPTRFSNIVVVEIRDYGFRDCEKLTDVTIDYGCKRIGKKAFENCNKLSQLAIPTSIEEIRDNAFKDCPNLKDIIYDGTKEEWNSISKGLNWKGSQVACTIYYKGDHTYEVI